MKRDIQSHHDRLQRRTVVAYLLHHRGHLLEVRAGRDAEWPTMLASVVAHADGDDAYIVIEHQFVAQIGTDTHIAAAG